MTRRESSASRETAPAGQLVGDATRDLSALVRDEVELERTRDHLAETVDALGHKLDVPARSRARLAQVDRRQAALARAGVLLVVALMVWRRRR